MVAAINATATPAAWPSAPPFLARRTTGRHSDGPAGLGVRFTAVGDAAAARP